MKTNSIQVKFITLGGVPYVDIRRCRDGIPTDRGISVPPDKIPDLLKALSSDKEASVINL